MFSAKSLTLLLIAYITNVNAHQSLHLRKPYLDSDVDSKRWKFAGDYTIDVEEQFRLVPDAPSKIGWVYSKDTLENGSFEIEMEYKIHGKGLFYGDGMALWMTQETHRNGNAMGNGSKFKGLGVFIDTFPNHDRSHSYPYISLMINDGTRVYDHEGDNAATSNGGCEAFARGQSFPTKVKVTYVKGQMLDLHVSAGADKWKLCTRVMGITLPDNLFVGVTAATGQVHDNHDLISLDTRDVPTSYGQEHKSEKVQSEEPSMHAGSIMSTIFKILAILGICGIIFTAYRARASGNSAKHF